MPNKMNTNTYLVDYASPSQWSKKTKWDGKCDCISNERNINVGHSSNLNDKPEYLTLLTGKSN